MKEELQVMKTEAGAMALLQDGAQASAALLVSSSGHPIDSDKVMSDIVNLRGAMTPGKLARRKGK